MLVWSQNGTTRVAYEDPLVLGSRYSLEGTENTVAILRSLLEHLIAGLATDPTRG